MSPDHWLEQYYQGEFFSGKFEHLKNFIQQHNLHKFSAQVITIGGTNGKGETARLINQLLLQNKQRTALWTSPHLLKVNERFVFDGSDITDDSLIKAFEWVKKTASRDDVSLSYFEFLFVTYLVLVKELPVDFLVLEVGLGGRLDAVNTLDADVCIITSIARDHQDLLGSRYRDILKEKLGIIRPSARVYTAFELEYLRDITGKLITNKVNSWMDLFKSKELSSQDNFSQRNQTMALKVVGDLLPGRVEFSIAADSFASRKQLIVQGDEYILFPSHNVDGFRKLVQFLSEAKYNNFKDIIISFSERSLKEIEAMVRIILGRFPDSRIVLYEFDHFKALQKEKLLLISKQFELDITDDKKFLHDFSPENRSKVLVTGSNYFLGHFLKCYSGECR